MAQTLDGKIGKDAQHFPDWTEKADKQLFVRRTKASGVMIFGRTTFETLPGKLPGRLHVILSRKAGDWDEREDNVVFTSLSPIKILEKLSTLGFDDVIVAGGTTINTLFFEAGVIDELLVTISPLVFGEGLGVFGPQCEMDLRLLSAEKIGEQTLCAHYEVQK